MGEAQRRAELMAHLPDDVTRKVHVHFVSNPEKDIVFVTLAKETPLPGFPLALLRMPNGTVVLNMASVAWLEMENLPAEGTVKLA